MDVGLAGCGALERRLEGVRDRGGGGEERREQVQVGVDLDAQINKPCQSDEPRLSKREGKRGKTDGRRALCLPRLVHALGLDGANDADEARPLLLVRHVPGVVGRLEAALVGQGPDLKEVDLLGRVAVVLRVADARACDRRE